MSTVTAYAPVRSPSPRETREPGATRGETRPDRVPGRKPHVCFVAPAAWPVVSGASNVEVVGGAEVQQGILARGLARAGFTVSMICLDYGQSEPFRIDGFTVYKAYRPDEGIPVVRFIHPRITSIWAAMKRVNADIYYQRSSAALTAIVALFCRRHGKKSLYAGASDVDFIPGRQEIKYARDRWLFEYGLKHVDAIVAQSPTQLQNLRRHYGRSATVIPSCFDAPPGAHADRGGYVLWAGSTRWTKRPDRLIEIARRLPQYRFVMLGRKMYDPREKKDQQDYWDEAAALGNVDVRGFVPYAEADRLFDGARVLLNTSEYEGFPNTFLQAWARGVPVVGFTDTGSYRNGQRVYPVVSSVDEAVEAVTRLMGDDLHWQQMSQRSALHFRERHSVPVAVSAYEQLFATLAGPPLS